MPWSLRRVLLVLLAYFVPVAVEASRAAARPRPASVYIGRVLGVSVRAVALTSHTAAIEMTGAAIGGRVHGRATVSTTGRVLLDPSLQKCLNQRACHIRQVEFLPASDTMLLQLDLPLFAATLRMRAEGVEPDELADEVQG